MEQIDESKRKPRRTRGTPSFHYRNRFAYAFIAAGTAIFAVWAYTPIFRHANDKLCKALLYPSEDEIDRRLLFSLPNAHTSKFIQEAIDDKKKAFSER